MSDVFSRLAAHVPGIRLYLLGGLGVVGVLVIPAGALGRHSTHSASHAASGAPSCHYAFYDAKADASDIKGTQANQLDLVQTTFGLNRADTKLRVVMKIKNLSKTIDAPANYNDYQVWWTNPSGDKGPNAVDASVSKGTVKYSDGTVTTVNGSTNYVTSKTSAATGSFGHGPNGLIEIDVPLKEMGLKVGQTVTKPIAGSADGASQIGLAQYSDVDPTTGGGHSYKLDSRTCIDTYP